MGYISHEDEADLQRKLVKILNKQDLNFRKTNSPEFCDLIDDINFIYVEVKTDFLSPAQIVYGLAKNNIKNARYIGLANAFEIRFYKTPSFKAMLEFAQSIDPELELSPSRIIKKDWIERAFELLKIHDIIYLYEGELDLNNRIKDVFINEDNYYYFQSIFEKYEINPTRFLTYVANLYSKNHEIIINNEGKILNKNTGKFFFNTDKEQKSLDTFFIDYKPIKDFRDKTLIESIRVKSEAVQKILHQIDRLEPIKVRRFRGRFFTKDRIGAELSDIVESINPDFIIEPYVGGGSLIASLTSNYKGIGNDINNGFIDILKEKYRGYNWKFTCVNTITTTLDSLNERWKYSNAKNLLILTNPPFGTSSTNIVSSKRNEVGKGKSRKIPIEYGGLEKIYGKGDLLIPAIGKLIEMIKQQKKGFLLFFSPAGVLCGRKKYNRIFRALLKDFKFIEGYIFSGKDFNSVSKKKPIALTLWEYNKNCKTDPESLIFMCEENPIGLKKLPLLKDGWYYRLGNKYVKNKKENALGVTRCERFNTPNGKFFGTDFKEGSGAELSIENLKVELNIPNIPSLLIYGLWSVCVGFRSISEHPLYFDNAYVHLPNLNKKETFEILALAVIHTLITEIMSNNRYAKGNIGFFEMERIFKFGDKEFTDGARYLIETYGDISIDDKNLEEIFEELKAHPDVSDIDSNYRAKIKTEISIRLEEIKYWDYIPIPENL